MLTLYFMAHLWWKGYNNRPKSHSGSAGTGPGTGQQDEAESENKPLIRKGNHFTYAKYQTRHDVKNYV